jgi:hypothetical protein
LFFGFHLHSWQKSSSASPIRCPAGIKSEILNTPCSMDFLFFKILLIILAVNGKKGSAKWTQCSSKFAMPHTFVFVHRPRSVFTIFQGSRQPNIYPQTATFTVNASRNS